ncbi:unnamed protein product [Owenia fusiformis]|uniref:Uncharacterized protein n=1 Tax=Owenia fusiformis TaxID=6347 RepID=A0A8J1XGH2_OWEFU|nr:unnamed protein product [Owenia fusiformis]
MRIITSRPVLAPLSTQEMDDIVGVEPTKDDTTAADFWKQIVDIPLSPAMMSPTLNTPMYDVDLGTPPHQSMTASPTVLARPLKKPALPAATVTSEEGLIASHATMPSLRLEDCILPPLKEPAPPAATVTSEEGLVASRATTPSLRHPIITQAIQSMAPGELQALETAIGTACRENVIASLQGLLDDWGLKIVSKGNQSPAERPRSPSPEPEPAMPGEVTPPHEEPFPPPPPPPKKRKAVLTVAQYIKRSKYVIPRKRLSLETRLQKEFGIPPIKADKYADVANQRLTLEIGSSPTFDLNLQESELTPPTREEVQAAAWKPFR